MGYSKDDLLARLEELKIDFECYNHPVVSTIAEQTKHVGDFGGALTKNLFLKDKKYGLYIVSALADTKFDMKILSQRLGLGRGGLQMAREDSLRQVLQVPLGCVSPFALFNESASDVSLLLDQGFKSKQSCYFHPLINDMTIALSSSNLDKFLLSIGKQPAYVDLEASPVVGQDNHPDLANLVPSSVPGFLGESHAQNKTVPKEKTCLQPGDEQELELSHGNADDGKEADTSKDANADDKLQSQPGSAVTDDTTSSGQQPPTSSRGYIKALKDDRIVQENPSSSQPPSPPGSPPAAWSQIVYPDEIELARWTVGLVEIMQVSANFPFVGTLMVCDQRSSKTLYAQDEWNKAHQGFVSNKNKWTSSKNAAVDFKDELELSGPCRATVADDGFVIMACVPATKKKDREICKFKINSSDSATFNTVKTHSIKLDRGCLFVTSVVLPEALEAFLEITLEFTPTYELTGNDTIYGIITARIGTFEISSTLFKKDMKEAMPLVPIRSQLSSLLCKVPLTRSKMAVPFGEVLHVTGTLRVCSHDDINIDRTMPILYEERITACGHDDTIIIIDHTMPIIEEERITPFVKGGKVSNSVRMCLSPVL